MRQFFQKPEFGRLLFRACIGAITMAYGVDIFMAGKLRWISLGGQLQSMGIDFSPLFFGIVAAFILSVCGLFFMLGILFRLATGLLFLCCALSTLHHLIEGHPFLGATSVVAAATAAFASFLFIGQGTYAISGE